MHKDTMENLEDDFAADLPEEDILDDPLLKQILAEPAFDDSVTIAEPEEETIYRNFSNGYGEAMDEALDAPVKKQSNVNAYLMLAASVLALGIVAVLAYWLIKFL